MDTETNTSYVILDYLSGVSPRPITAIQFANCVKNAVDISVQESSQFKGYQELTPDAYNKFVGEYVIKWISRLYGFSRFTNHTTAENTFSFVRFYVRDDVSYKRFLELISRFCETCRHAEIDKVLHAETDMEYFLNDAPKPG